MNNKQLFDTQGNQIKIGDKIVYFTKYNRAYFGKVIGFKNVMTQIEYLEHYEEDKYKKKYVYSTKSLLLNN